MARVGPLGFVTLQDMVAFFSALEPALKDLNQPVEPGQSISAVLRAYAETSAPPARTARGAARREPDAVAGGPSPTLPSSPSPPPPNASGELSRSAPPPRIPS